MTYMENVKAAVGKDELLSALSKLVSNSEDLVESLDLVKRHGPSEDNTKMGNAAVFPVGESGAESRDPGKTAAFPIFVLDGPKIYVSGRHGMLDSHDNHLCRKGAAHGLPDVPT